MELFNIIIVVAVVCVLYLIWDKFRKNTSIPAETKPEAPYKVEPAKEIWPESAEATDLAKAAVAKVVTPAAEVKPVPELKVVSNTPNKSSSPKPRARRPATPRKPRQPTQK